MRIQDALLRVWQMFPVSWRAGLVNSKVAPPLRRLMNTMYPNKPAVFPLAAPLEGYRMHLDWRASKAFVFGTFEQEVTRALLQIVQQNWVVLDLGAHIGYFALLLSRLVGPRGKVIAFEPLSENIRTLEQNLTMNDCRNVVLERRAVAATTGTVILRLNDDNQLSSTASLEHGRPTAVVDAVSLDDYVSGLRERIDFVIMDVEGAEAAVLRGMRATLMRDRPILVVELHGFDLYRQDHPALQTLQSMNYRFRFLDTPGAQAHVLAEPAKPNCTGGHN